MKKTIFACLLSCAALSAGAQEPAPLTLHLHLEHKKVAGRGIFKIFILNEESQKLTYVDLLESKPGDFVGEIQVGAKDPSVVAHYRIGEMSSEKDRYFSFQYGAQDSHTVAIELDATKVTRAKLQRTQVAGLNAPITTPPTTPSAIAVTLLSPRKVSELVVYNEALERATYVQMQPRGKGASGKFQLNTLLKDFVDHWRVSLPSKEERRYFSFTTQFTGERKLNVQLSDALFTRAELPQSPGGENPTTLASGRTPFATYQQAVELFNRGENAAAMAAFQDVLNHHDPLLEMYSRYYLGVLLIKEKKFDEADAQLRELTESPTVPGDIRRNSLELLRQTGQLQNHQSRMEKRFGGGVNFDFLQYDSNIITLPGSLAPASNQGGFGLGLQGYVWYAPLLREKQEITFSYLFSTSYYPEDTFINYAMGSHILSGKYVHKGEWRGKALNWTSSPGAGFIQSQVDGIRKTPPTNDILDTYFWQNQWLYLASPTQWLEGRFNVKYDNSKVPRASDLDSATGFGMLVGISALHFLNESRTRSYAYGLNAEWLSAEGQNYRQLKPSLFASYSDRLPWAIQAKASLSLYQDFYYRNLSDRNDQQLKADFTFTRNLSSALALTQSFSVGKNFSTVELGRYFRFVSTTTLGLTF